MKNVLLISMLLLVPAEAFAKCKTYDLLCDQSTGLKTYDLNRDNKKKTESIRTGAGTWDLNTDRNGSKRYDLNSRNGCKSWDLNCK